MVYSTVTEYFENDINVNVYCLQCSYEFDLQKVVHIKNTIREYLMSQKTPNENFSKNGNTDITNQYPIGVWFDEMDFHPFCGCDVVGWICPTHPQ